MPTITTVQALLVLKPVIEGATTSTSSSTHQAQLPEGLIPELCAAISRYIHPITVSLLNVVIYLLNDNCLCVWLATTLVPACSFEYMYARYPRSVIFHVFMHVLALAIIRVHVFIR
jgi:hypothetical protein